MFRAVACTFLVVAYACDGRSPAEPLPNEPIDHVQTVLAGRVLDGAGNPLAGAMVDVSVRCSPDPAHDCQTGTSRVTGPDGRFVIWLDQDHTVEFSTKAEVQAWPPLGMGYVLGTATVEDLDAVFQRAPAVDTTFVDIVLPPDSVESRQPARIDEVGHRTTRLRLGAGRVYMSSPGGVAAMDAATGEWLWQEGSTSGLAGPPYVLAGDVIVMAHGTTLTAVRAEDGGFLWSREGALTRSLTAGEGEIFASDGPVVAAYDLASGATHWSHELIGSGNIVIAAGEDLVCAEILAFVECWEPSTGDPVWSRPTDFANWLAVVDDRVILGAESGWTGFDTETGAELWRTAVTTFNSPALVEGGDSMFACSSVECLAVRVSDGTVAWRTAVPDPGPPGTDGRSVYVVGWVDDSSTLYVLEAATGAIRERLLPDPFDGGFGGTPVVGEDLVFVIGSGHLYAFEKR